MADSRRKPLSRKGKEPPRPGSAPLVEWIAAGVGLALVLGAAGFLLADASGEPPSPPRISVQVDSIVRSGDSYLVEFRVRNAGQTTAAALNVEGVLRGAAGGEERSQVTIDYVPAEGERRAGLFFSEDPRSGSLEIRPTSYDRP